VIPSLHLLSPKSCMQFSSSSLVWRQKDKS
jgi:hypothetical protein